MYSWQIILVIDFHVNKENYFILDGILYIHFS